MENNAAKSDNSNIEIKPAAQKKISLLIVDDEAANLSVLNAILRSDYDIFTAKTGEFALRLAAEKTPHLILLDIMMPDMNGFQVLARLKANPETAAIPVIFITGLTSERDEERGFSLGAVDYITKPFISLVVKARIATHLKNAKRLNMVKDDLLRISSIVEGSPDFELFLNANGNLEYMNPAISEISGYTHEELSAGGLDLLLSDEDIDKLYMEYLPVAMVDRSINFELPIKRKDGQIRILSTSAFAVTLHNGESGLGLSGRDETEKKFMQKELLEAKERTEKALRQAEYYNKAKSDFLSRMSHEMRTPLNVIMGMIDIALNVENYQLRKNYLGTMKEASAHLLEIITDVLDMSQLDTGKFVLTPREFSLHALLKSVYAAASINAKAKDQNISLAVAAGIPDHLEADDRSLKIVFSHLLSNAVKFTPPYGTIGITAKIAASDEIVATDLANYTLRFEVSDTGKGIPLEQQDRLFRAFEQMDNSITREHSGTGLGLAICKSIIELMGGRIWVEAANGTQGSRFIFTVTLKNAAAQREAGDDSVINLNGKHLLIVDDVDMNREILIALLENSGAVFSTAENGVDAIGIYQEKGCDLVLMDIHMPKMDGIEAARRIRSSVRHGADRVPIIAVTADTNIEMRRRCLEAGMNDQITKPVDFTMLFDTIKKYIA